MEMATKKISSRDLLNYIAEVYQERKYPPTYREISARFDVSTATTYQTINRLSAEGHIIKTPGRRGFTVVGEVPEPIVNRPGQLIIGICGFAQSGKDTLAEQLVKFHQFERKGFADALRGILYALNPLVPGTDGFTPTRVRTIVGILGWERAKTEVPEIRALLQRLGTEGGREHLGEDVWVNAVLGQPHSRRLVIPDVRFPNEAAAIKARGGHIIRVTRPFHTGSAPVNTHVSETAYTGGDVVISNDGTPVEMLEKVINFFISKGVEI